MKPPALNMLDLVARGWSEEKMIHLLGLSKKMHMNLADFSWPLPKIERLETLSEFLHFTTAQQALESKAALMERQMHLSTRAMTRLEHLGAMEVIDNPQSLVHQGAQMQKEKEAKRANAHHMDSLHKNNNIATEVDFLYRQHIPFENLPADVSETHRWHAFTDGSLRRFKNQEFICCAGWISDAKHRVVAEFTQQMRPSETHKADNFEQIAIELMAEIIHQHDLSGVLLHTDSSSDALHTALQCPHHPPNGTAHLLHVTKSDICYIPREYNTHADSLTKVWQKMCHHPAPQR